MSKIRRLATPTRVKKITGGKDPIKLVEDFLAERSIDPESCLEQKSSDSATWSMTLAEDEVWEITLEGLNSQLETTLYIGVNVASVPLKRTAEFLLSALSVADTLIGAKLSIVNYDLVLSATVYVAHIGSEDIDYLYELIRRQKVGVRDTISAESDSS